MDLRKSDLFIPPATRSMLRWSLAASSLFLTLLVVSATAALPPPSPSPPVFQERPFGPRPAPTPPRPRLDPAPAKPLPRGLLFGAGAFAVLASSALIFGAVRAWRTSNLFGRQYRFPVRGDVAPRLGGERSGGMLATVRFAPDDNRPPEPALESKDT